MCSLRGYLPKLCLLEVAGRKGGELLQTCSEQLIREDPFVSLGSVTAKLTEELSFSLALLIFPEVKWRIGTAPPTSFTLLPENWTSVEAKSCLLYFGNPEVFPLIWCFQNKIFFFWFCLPRVIYVKQLPAVRCVVPSQPGCPAAALEAWGSGSLRRTWLFLINQYKERGRCRVRHN